METLDLLDLDDLDLDQISVVSLRDAVELRETAGSCPASQFSCVSSSESI